MNRGLVYTLALVSFLCHNLLAKKRPVDYLANTRPAFFNIHNNNLVKLHHFSAYSDGKKVTLMWKNNPVNKCDYFTIEKSKDGIHFNTALIVKGAGHNTTLLDYSDIDFNPLSGLSYYRIKQTDYEGHAIYSSIVPVNFHYTKDGNMVTNTGTEADNAGLSSISNKEILVVVRDKNGMEYTAKVVVSKDQNQKLVATDGNRRLNKGSYLVVASSNNALYSRKLTVN